MFARPIAHLTVAAVLPVLILPMPAGAAEEVGGKVAVRAPASGSALVTLPEATSVLPSSDGSTVKTTFSGSAEVRGLILRAEKPTADGRYPQVTINGSLPHFTETFATVDKLPAGDYRLYGLASRGDVSVDLEFPYGSGTHQLAARGPAAFSFVGFQTLSSQANSATFAAIADGDAPGTVLTAGRILLGSDSVTRSELCLRQGADVEGAGAFAPGCADSGSVQFADSDGEYSASAIVTLDKPNRIGWGGNVQYSADAPQIVGGSGYLTFEPPTTVTPTTPSVGSPMPAATLPRRSVLHLVSRTLRVARGKALLRVACTGSQSCPTEARLNAGRPARAVVGADAKATLRVALSRSLRRAVARRGRVAATLTAVMRNDAGAQVLTTRVILRRAR